jgi:thiamine kinase-like enzyme
VNLHTLPDDAELCTILGGILEARTGRGSPIAHLSRRASTSRSSFALEELDVGFADGTRVELVWKDLAHRALHEDACRAKPAFLYDPFREIETYRLILNAAGLGTATYYGSVADVRQDRYWLFLERVPDDKLSQIGEQETWRRVAAWLGGFHTHFTTRVGAFGSRQSEHLLRYNSTLYRIWLKRARNHVARADEPEILLHLAACYERLIERLIRFPATLIHGEFYASNILVPATEPAGRRVCPVDWEMAAIGPRALDLAALTAGNWTREQRDDLVDAYYRATDGAQASDGGRRALDEELDCCRFHVAMQWLTWSTEWTPPPQHAHDWMSEAVHIAERLGL